MTYALNANQTPTPNAKPSSLIDTNATSPAPLVSQTVVNGDTTAGVTKINRNASIADAAARAQGYGIVQGLSLVMATGSQITVKAGQALMDGPITLSADTTIALVDGVNQIWLLSDGTPHKVPASLVPPTARMAVFLGTLTVAGGVVTVIDLSGVVFVLDGALWRQTNDADKPNDSPPPDMALYTRTQAGLWIWDGVKHSPLSLLQLRAFEAGVPAASAKTLLFVAPRALSFVLGMATAQGYCATAATASTVFSIRKNGTEFATATFAASGQVASFSNTSATSLAAGDVLSILAPASPDATLADVAFTLEAIA